MPFYFLHPIYLYGLLAASLPLIIHLLNRRRLRRIRFPTVKFILLSQRRVSRSYNLRHWLLLALRTLSVLLLVLLLANPIFQSGVGLWAGGEPLSLVVVLDNSLSMKWNGGGQSFERAKEAARVLVSSFKKGDQGALIPTYLPADREILLTPRKELLRRELEATRITATTADFTQALNHAYELLSGPTRQKAIWLITDMGLTGWDRFDLSSLKQYDPLIPLKVLHVGGKPEPFNATVKEVRIRGQGVARDLPLEVGATIVNFGNQEIQDVLVQLRLDEQNRDQQIIALPPHGEAEVIFQLRLDRAGSHTGEVVMEKAGIAGNSTLSFVLHAQEKIRILVVDGDSKTSLAQSESFFLIRALHPGGEGRPSLFLPTVIPPEAMSSTSLSSYQAIILCNVPVIPQDVASGMAEYVRGGGGVLLFLGDRVQRDDYNRKLFDSPLALLPARIGDRRLIPPAQEETLGEINSAHPALNGSAGFIEASLNTVRVRGYFRVASPSGTTLLALANGDPLLLERKIGPGKVFLFNTTADSEWSDLPFKTAYLPLIQSLVHYLSREGKGSADLGILAGAEKVLSFPVSYAGQDVKITKPDLREGEITASAEDDRAVATFRDNDVPGIYRVTVAPVARQALQDSVPALYAVNPRHLESRLKEIPPDELRDKIRPLVPEFVPLESLKEGGTKRDLSFPVLLLLMATLLWEGWLAQRIDE